MSDSTPPPPGGWGQQPPPGPTGPPPGQWGQQPPADQPSQWGQQGPPPGQPGQQWGQQPGGSSGGLEPNVGAMLAYLLFGWIGGLIMYLTQKHPEVRFHGAQSVLLFGGLNVLQILLSFIIAPNFSALGLIFLLSSLVSLFSFGMWVFMSIQGYQLNHLKLPVIGDIAEQWAAKPS